MLSWNRQHLITFAKNAIKEPKISLQYVINRFTRANLYCLKNKQEGGEEQHIYRLENRCSGVAIIRSKCKKSHSPGIGKKYWDAEIKHVEYSSANGDTSRINFYHCSFLKNSLQDANIILSRLLAT